jgi:hypothetical protein
LQELIAREHTSGALDKGPQQTELGPPQWDLLVRSIPKAVTRKVEKLPIELECRLYGLRLGLGRQRLIDTRKRQQNQFTPEWAGYVQYLPNKPSEHHRTRL